MFIEKMADRVEAFKEFITSNILILDGAMGTQIQQRGLALGQVPETFNIEQPEVIEDIHRAYIDAGAHVVTSNTFGANRLKLETTGYSVQEIIRSGVSISRRAAGERAWVALDVGPLGELLQPMGTLAFDEAYELFREQVEAGEAAGADLILIETMNDLGELRAAALAAKENTSLPIFCSMSFEPNERTFMGCSVEALAMSLEGIVDAVGINCSMGPAEILPIAKKLLKWANLPVFVQPNAGLPEVVNGQTVYGVGPEEFAQYIKKFIEAGVSIVGGCCGTTPEHIRQVAQTLAEIKPKRRSHTKHYAICTPSTTVDYSQIRVIGERINPTGKKLFQQALRENDMDYIIRQAISQVEAGAEILDVNVGLPDIDEVSMLVQVVQALQAVVDVPLQIDSSNPEAIEKALRVYHGKAIVNSVNGEKKVMETILPIVKKYNAAVVALTLDENGIPSKAEQRFHIAHTILTQALKNGIRKENVLVDCLTLTVSAQQEDAAQTLEAVRLVKEKLGLKTVLGVSNISFGLPRRDIVNETFLAMALANGLDLPIMNPNMEGMMKVVLACRVLKNIDVNAERYIERYADTKPQETAAKPAGERDLKEIVIKGLRDEAAEATKKLLQEKEELGIVNDYLIPALDIVGERYEKNEIFLPQLIQSAETVQQAFEVLKERLATQKESMEKGTIVMATVKGDIHDIGKNIVKVILENYGYRIIDLGRDVPVETVVETAKKEQVKLVGLSALMTTTVKSMEETIQALHETCPGTLVFVGGAVLTPEYAAQIGADFYSKDARESVEIARKIFG